MLAFLNNFFNLKEKTLWYHYEEDLARVPVSGVILTNYGFLDAGKAPELTRIGDDLWVDSSGVEVNNHGIEMPFTILK